MHITCIYAYGGVYFCFTCVGRPEFHWFKSPYFFAVVVVVAAAAAAAVGLMTVLYYFHWYPFFLP